MYTLNEIFVYGAEKSDKAFSNFQQVEEAYKKHCARVASRKFVDPLREHFKEYQTKYKDKLYDKHSSWYNFSEIRGILKKHRLWGMEAFNEHDHIDTTCHLCIDTTCLLYDRYGVSIYKSDYCDELYIKGLLPCDFMVLLDAHRAK